MMKWNLFSDSKQELLGLFNYQLLHYLQVLPIVVIILIHHLRLKIPLQTSFLFVLVFVTITSHLLFTSSLLQILLPLSHEIL